MARISYIEEKDHPELAAETAKIKGGRGAVINIYKLLLHSPGVAMSWLEHSNTIRWKTSLTPRLRELAIIRIAQVARYAYALQQHVPAIALADGVSLDECEALRDWRASGFFGEHERAALAYVDAMIAGPEVADEVFDAMRTHYNEREIVELSVLVGTYLMHNRVFGALRVDCESKQS
ncbi:MAG: carboxymuconolactone decarboxylase family protein [Betaproteobacteria bacterium]|nr:carboxymuconolactone decarboxylase family protein [Betaproteobacteria bacterium]